LYGGNTVHSTFFVTNDVDCSTEPKLSRSTHTAEILRKAEVIIIDEISCLDNAVLGYVDRLFRFLYKGQTRADYPFANKIFILGGDWKQIMPVAKDEYEQFMKSVKNHPLFQHFEVHRLVQNMRLLANQVEYRKFCIATGTGSNYEPESLDVNLQYDMIAQNENDLIDFVFGHPVHGTDTLKKPLKYSDFLSDRAILSPHNAVCKTYNQMLMNKIDGEVVKLKATDRIRFNEESVDDVLAMNVAQQQMEIIEKRTPNGFPDHLIELKKGSIVIMIKNISTPGGLSNGTRLQVLNISSSLLVCKHLFGTRKGKTVYLSKSIFEYGKSQGEGVPFDRIQFPIKLAFAMTVNKAQGQTLGNIGLALRESQCFSHGQAYVAFSRVKSSACIKVLTRESENKIQNVVFYDILDVDERPKDIVVPKARTPAVNPIITKSPDVSNVEMDDDSDQSSKVPLDPVTPSAGMSQLSLQSAVTDTPKNSTKRKPRTLSRAPVPAKKQILEDVHMEDIVQVSVEKNKQPELIMLSASPPLPVPAYDAVRMQADLTASIANTPADYSRIDFATAKNPNCQIWRSVDLPLFVNEGDRAGDVASRSIRRLELQFNNLNEWLNDTMLVAYLYVLAKASTQHVVIVDPLVTREDMGRILNFDPDRSIFNYELGRIPDIVLIPMHFANHWGLIVHDCTFGTFFADSKIGFVTITPQRLQLIENILQFLLDDQTFSTNLQVLTRNQCSQQPDGNSCGYYVDLFAERYLKDRRFDLGQFDLRLEKRRILWHINQLYTTDDVTFRPGNFH
jgi:hypothetical protein